MFQRLEIILALVFGGLALTGILIPELGFFFLGLAVLLSVHWGYSWLRQKNNTKVDLPRLRPRRGRKPLELDLRQCSLYSPSTPGLLGVETEVTITPHGTVQLARLQLDLGGDRYDPVEMPASVLERIETHTVRYEVEATAILRNRDRYVHPGGAIQNTYKGRLYALAAGSDVLSHEFTIPYTIPV